MNDLGKFSGVNKARFTTLWARSQVPGAQVNTDSVWDAVVYRYTEPQRYYHSIRHLQRCLQQFDLVRDRIEEADAVEMALWFHDIVYFPGAKNNEMKSAELFEQVAAGKLTPEFVAVVRELILATEHQQIQEQLDACYVVDIDLSGFGLSWEEYLADNHDLREELKDMPDRQYYAAKLQFLHSLLERRRIYCTDYFYDRYEHKARRNIHRYLAEFAEGKLT